MWWNSSSRRGRSTVARMLVRMISSPYNLIKHYSYVVDHLSWALVMMILMILIVGNYYAFVEF